MNYFAAATVRGPDITSSDNALKWIYSARFRWVLAQGDDQFRKDTWGTMLRAIPQIFLAHLDMARYEAIKWDVTHYMEHVVQALMYGELPLDERERDFLLATTKYLTYDKDSAPDVLRIIRQTYPEFVFPGQEEA